MCNYRDVTSTNPGSTAPTFSKLFGTRSSTSRRISHDTFEIMETMRRLEMELRNALNHPNDEVRCGAQDMLLRIFRELRNSQT